MQELKIDITPLTLKKFFFSDLSVQIHRRDITKKIYDSKLIKHSSEGSHDFTLDVSDSCQLTGDIKILFLNKSKEIVFSVSFNTFCSFNSFKENEYSLNEQSCQGCKRLDEEEGKLVWTLTKELLDGGAKNKNLDTSFKLEFIIETNEIAKSKPGTIKESDFSNRISHYDNVESVLGCYSMGATRGSLIEEEEKGEKPKKFRDLVDEEIINRKPSIFNIHHTVMRRIRLTKKPAKSLYKSNSEPFLNSLSFRPEMIQSRKSSIESLDIELEKSQT